MTKEIEEAIELLMQLRIKSSKIENRVNEKDLYDVQQLLHKAMDSLTPSGDVQERAKELADEYGKQFRGDYQDNHAEDIACKGFENGYLAGASSMQGEVERVKDSYSERNEGWEKAIDLQAENERLRDENKKLVDEIGRLVSNTMPK